MTEVVQYNASTERTAKIIYILYLVGIVIGITGIIGVIMAYINKTDAPAWLQSHYQFQVRTFWIGFLYLIIGGILTLAVIGYSLAVGLSIFLRVALAFEHPPAAGTALGVAMTQFSPAVAITVLTGSIVLSLAHRFLRRFLRDLV